LTNRQIARRMRLAEEVVRHCVSRLLVKLGVARGARVRPVEP